MKRLKLISLAICVAMLVVSLAACSSSNREKAKGRRSNGVENGPYKAGRFGI